VATTARRVVLGTVVGLALLADPAGAASADGASTFLWRVDGGSAPVWLLGSVHAMRPGEAPLPDAVTDAFDAARVAVFEVELEQLGAAAVKMMVRGTLTGGETLADVVPPELYRETVRHAGRAGVDPSMLASMKPWMAALTLTSLELVNAGYDPSEGIDMVLYTRARAAGKRIVALETVDQQVALFADMSRKESVAFLRYTLADLETVVPMLDDITAAWRRGDASVLADLLTEGFEDAPGLYESIVVDRNAAWQETIEDLLRGDDPAIVVVGALHLVGEEGLVTRLRRAGYTVTQQ
jgi:uncharacterized protein YbaP (TraB family)